MTFTLSVLDLSPVPSGSTGAQALRNTLDLARLADRLGYERYWLAEHHNLPGVASSSPEIMIGHVASVTERIRVGAGGIMLPNHAPLKVVETFRVLEALHPERIDLGIGRAPGTDPMTAIALRRSREAVTSDDFPELMRELFAFAGNDFPADHPFHPIRAIPVDVELPPIWLLGSSNYSGQVAAAIGTGFAFAAHFSPTDPVPIMLYYREHFTPSESFQEPHSIIAAAVICADTDDEAEELATSLGLSFLLRQRGQSGPLPSPEEARDYPYTEIERQQIAEYRKNQIVGSPATVRPQIEDLVSRTRADEIMITSHIHDHGARLHSYELLAGEFGLHERESAG
ncbi:MAG TPA: LLM class flavin-dependent oxidoreductase [Thermomicrobiales bacterium]|nr:LLM class flavin-dependent oxidoreductase [Thermomicrobiales bacterium]